MLVVAIIALRSPHGPHSSQAAASSPAARVPAASRTSTAPHSGVPRSKGASSSSATGTSSATASTASLRTVPLLVLNNTTTPGLASAAASRFTAGGWKVSGTGNLTNNIASTCAYYAAGNTQAEAAAKALQAQFPAIKRVREKFPELPAGPLVVVLTPDYTTG